MQLRGLKSHDYERGDRLWQLPLVECAAQGSRECKFTQIVMVHVQIAFMWHDSSANLRKGANYRLVMRVGTCKSYVA